MLQLGLRLGLGPGNGVFRFSSFFFLLFFFLLLFFIFLLFFFFLSQTSWCMGPVSEGTPREDPGTSVGNTGHPSRSYVKSPTAQDIFRPIPGLISCAGVTRRWGLPCHAQHVANMLCNQISFINLCCFWYSNNLTWIIKQLHFRTVVVFSKQVFQASVRRGRESLERALALVYIHCRAQQGLVIVT